MIARYATFVLIPALVFLLAPALAGGAYLAHPGPWLGFVLGVVTLASQPPLTPAALVSDASDQRSALGIFLAVVVANLASVVQFASRAAVLPAPASWWVAVGTLCALGGMGLRLWAIRSLGRFFTSSVMVQEGQRVLTDGPYRWLRHPSYTGTLLTALGIAVMVASPLGILATVALVLPAYVYRIRVEERTMVAGLGAAYAAYRERTPALFPWPSR